MKCKKHGWALSRQRCANYLIENQVVVVSHVRHIKNLNLMDIHNHIWKCFNKNSRNNVYKFETGFNINVAPLYLGLSPFPVIVATKAFYEFPTPKLQSILLLTITGARGQATCELIRANSPTKGIMKITRLTTRHIYLH